MNSITQQLIQFGWDEWFNVKVQEMGSLSGSIMVSPLAHPASACPRQAWPVICWVQYR